MTKYMSNRYCTLISTFPKNMDPKILWVKFICSKNWESWTSWASTIDFYKTERLNYCSRGHMGWKALRKSLSSWKLLQCVQFQVQDALKSLAEKPKNSDQHILGFRSVDILLSNDPCLRLFIDLRTFVLKFCRRNLRIFSRDFFETEK